MLSDGEKDSGRTDARTDRLLVCFLSFLHSEVMSGLVPDKRRRYRATDGA